MLHNKKTDSETIPATQQPVSTSVSVKVTKAYSKGGGVFIDTNEFSTVDSPDSPNGVYVFSKISKTYKLSDAVAMSISNGGMTLDNIKNYSYSTYITAADAPDNVPPIDVKNNMDTVVGYLNRNLLNKDNAGLFSITLKNNLVVGMYNLAYSN